MSELRESVNRRARRVVSGLTILGALGCTLFGLGRSLGAAATTMPTAPASTMSVGGQGHGAYVGDEACRSCHQNKVETYHQTAHARTSRAASADSILGRFDAGSNILRTSNPDLLFLMEHLNSGHFQKGVIRTPAQILERSERIDVVIGSGRKGQSYLFWDGDSLCQLPVSYWSEMGEWVNSPGYIDGKADFERPIAPRCLECHASSFEVRSLPNHYTKASLTLGISCEKCHGPGRKHVELDRSKIASSNTAASAILNPARLTRDRQMDVCALCHAGIGKPRAPALSFVPGQSLDRYLETPKSTMSAHVDVHGSQVQLLERSRCFQNSPALTCTTCHDVHTPERDPTTFVSECVKCHQVESCGARSRLGSAIDRQCITCHMPLQETEQIIISGRDGRSLQPKVRNHEIGIYPEISLP